MPSLLSPSQWNVVKLKRTLLSEVSKVRIEFAIQVERMMEAKQKSEESAQRLQDKLTDEDDRGGSAERNLVTICGTSLLHSQFLNIA